MSKIEIIRIQASHDAYQFEAIGPGDELPPGNTSPVWHGPAEEAPARLAEFRAEEDERLAQLYAAREEVWQREQERRARLEPTWDERIDREYQWSRWEERP